MTDPIRCRRCPRPIEGQEVGELGVEELLTRTGVHWGCLTPPEQIAADEEALAEAEALAEQDPESFPEEYRDIPARARRRAGDLRKRLARTRKFEAKLRAFSVPTDEGAEG